MCVSRQCLAYILIYLHSIEHHQLSFLPCLVLDALFQQSCLSHASVWHIFVTASCLKELYQQLSFHYILCRTLFEKYHVSVARVWHIFKYICTLSNIINFDSYRIWCLTHCFNKLACHTPVSDTFFFNKFATWRITSVTFIFILSCGICCLKNIMCQSPVSDIFFNVFPLHWTSLTFILIVFAVRRFVLSNSSVTCRRLTPFFKNRFASRIISATFIFIICDHCLKNMVIVQNWNLQEGILKVWSSRSRA